MTDENIAKFWRLIDRFNMGLSITLEDRLFLKAHAKDFDFAL